VVGSGGRGLAARGSRGRWWNDKEERQEERKHGKLAQQVPDRPYGTIHDALLLSRLTALG
jgi:hypothetical protein